MTMQTTENISRPNKSSPSKRSVSGSKATSTIKPVTDTKAANGPWVSLDGKRHANRRRPSVHDEGALQRVCDALIEGLSIKQACKPDNMPRWQEIYLEMQRDEEVRNAIAHAREAQQEVTADDIVDMADLATPDDHNVVKLRIWARQWRAAKLAPKKYGERQSIEVTADIGKTAANVLMELTERARSAKTLEHNVIDVTPQRFADTLPPK